MLNKLEQQTGTEGLLSRFIIGKNRSEVLPLNNGYNLRVQIGGWSIQNSRYDPTLRIVIKVPSLLKTYIVHKPSSFIHYSCETWRLSLTFSIFKKKFKTFSRSQRFSNIFKNRQLLVVELNTEWPFRYGKFLLFLLIIYKKYPSHKLSIFKN